MPPQDPTTPARPKHAPVPERAADLALFSVEELREPAGETAPAAAQPEPELVPIPIEEGDLSGLLRQLWAEQQRFDRLRAEQLGTDRIGLATLDLLLILGPQPPSVLAAHAGCSNAVMTLSLNRLEQRGHIVRGTHPTDQRKILVLFAEGSAELVEALTAPRDTRVERAVAGMSRRAKQNAADFLSQMLAAHRA